MRRHYLRQGEKRVLKKKFHLPHPASIIVIETTREDHRSRNAADSKNPDTGERKSLEKKKGSALFSHINNTLLHKCTKVDKCWFFRPAVVCTANSFRAVCAPRQTQKVTHSHFFFFYRAHYTHNRQDISKLEAADGYTTGFSS